MSAVLIACGTVYIKQDMQDVVIDFEEIHWFARRAKAAYETPAKIKEDFPNTVYVGTVPSINVQFFVEVDHDKKQQLISIRGTTNLSNVKQDADYIEVKDNKLGIAVHEGFDSDVRAIYKDVMRRLIKDYDVKVTGHSLGAAMATILMIYLHEDGFNIKHSVNFGQPKFTNKHGAKKYGFIPLLRVENKNDLVPLLPPVTLLDSEYGIYAHFKPELIPLNDYYYSYLVEHDAERYSVNSFWLNLGQESIKEHFMDNYLANIKSKLSRTVQVPYNDREKYINKTKPVPHQE